MAGLYRFWCFREEKISLGNFYDELLKFSDNVPVCA